MNPNGTKPPSWRAATSPSASPSVRLGPSDMSTGMLAVFTLTGVRPGNAVMYFPETNVLIPKTADAKSKTPAFKNVVVTIDP